MLEIWDRNDTIGAAPTVAEIEAIWLDVQSGLSINLPDSIGTLSVHINQAPTGSATAELVNGAENVAHVIDVANLLEDFGDVDGGTLAIASVSASDGLVALDASGSAVTITPTPGYYGPVELTYQVLDGQGGSAPASELYVIDAALVAINHNPTGTP